MATKLNKKEQAKTKADFDPPVDPGQTTLFDQKGTGSKKPSFRDQVEARGAKAAAARAGKKPIVTELAGDERDDKRSKTLSLRVYADIHDAFTKINRRRGMSTNSVLNMLITQYIRENKDILDD